MEVVELTHEDFELLPPAQHYRSIDYTHLRPLLLREQYSSIAQRYYWPPYHTPLVLLAPPLHPLPGELTPNSLASDFSIDSSL